MGMSEFSTIVLGVQKRFCSLMDEGDFENVVDSWPLKRILNHHLVVEFCKLRRISIWQSWMRSSLNKIHKFQLILVIERQFEGAELVENDAEGPNICLMSCRRLLYLRRHVRPGT